METKSDSAHKLARQIMEIVPYAMRAMMSEMRQSHQSNMMVMPGHFRLLGMLSHRNWTLTELADKQAVSPPTMSNTITTLEERGWVTRTRSAEDRRSVVIQATEEGRKILEETHTRAESYIAALLEPLDPAEQDILAQGLTVLRRVFETASPAPAEENHSSVDCQADQ
jgi:DNA-binding MarR family transcriptional regulator